MIVDLLKILSFWLKKYKIMGELLDKTIELDVNDTEGEKHSIRLTYKYNN